MEYVLDNEDEKDVVESIESVRETLSLLLLDDVADPLAVREPSDETVELRDASRVRVMVDDDESDIVLSSESEKDSEEELDLVASPVGDRESV